MDLTANSGSANVSIKGEISRDLTGGEASTSSGAILVPISALVNRWVQGKKKTMKMRKVFLAFFFFFFG